MLLAPIVAAAILSVAPAEPSPPAAAGVSPEAVTVTPAETAAPASTAVATATPSATATPTPTASATAPATPAPTAPASAAYVVPLTIHLPARDAAAPEPAAAAVTLAEDPSPIPPAPLGPALADSPPVLLSRVDRARGHAIERLIEPSGEIVEHEVNAAGTVQSCRPVGRLDALRIVTQQPAAEGEVVQVVRDASGALVRFVVAADGEPRGVALLAPPP